MTAPITLETRPITALSNAEFSALYHRKETEARQHGRDKMGEFIDDGLYYYEVKQLITEHNRRFPERATSFNQWIADPLNCVSNPSGTHLSVQTIEIWHVYFKLPAYVLKGTGIAKFIRLNPEMKLWIADIGAGVRTFDSGVEAAMDWLFAAENISVTALEALLIERTIAYSRNPDKNAGEGTTGAQTGKFTVLFERQPVKMSALRECRSVAEVLALLALSDMTDDRVIYPYIITTEE